jgi:hypothetical protein
VCCIEDDEEIEYGKLYVHSLGDDSEAPRPLGADDIWPHWSEGIPTKLRKTSWSPAFNLGKIYHNPRLSSEMLELEWHGPHLLSVLRQNYRLLPSSTYAPQWNGIYRIFSPNTTIDRICGKDPTGTLYLGRAGSERAGQSFAPAFRRSLGNHTMQRVVGVIVSCFGRNFRGNLWL